MRAVRHSHVSLNTLKHTLSGCSTLLELSNDPAHGGRSAVRNSGTCAGHAVDAIVMAAEMACSPAIGTKVRTSVGARTGRPTIEARQRKRATLGKQQQQQQQQQQEARFKLIPVLPSAGNQCVRSGVALASAAWISHAESKVRPLAFFYLSTSCNSDRMSSTFLSR
jgi:hypothetical protein